MKNYKKNLKKKFPTQTREIERSHKKQQLHKQRMKEAKKEILDYEIT